MGKGILITFEGPEGSGKSTQIKLLCSYLRRKRLKILCLREPGGTKISERIRHILLEPGNINMDGVCEMLLYQAARAQLVREEILPALKRNKIVILDRFLDSTIAYQGYGQGLGIELIRQVGRLATGGLKPDLTILLDINATAGLRKSGRRDRMEKKSLQFHRRAREGYLKLAGANPHRIKVVTVARDIAKTQEAIRKIVEQRISKTSNSE